MADLNAAFNSLTALTTILKGLRGLERAVELAELRSKMVDALEQASDTREVILALQEQNTDLQEKLTRRVAMHWIPPAYWQKREGQPNDGPFCPQCWDSEEKEIRLHPLHNGGLICKTCGNVFGDRPQRERTARSGLSDFYSAGT